MILETILFLDILANIIGSILTVLSPLVVPIGEVMVRVVSTLLEYFPYGNLALYIALFIIFIAAGIIANTSLIGDKLTAKFNKFDEKHFKKYTKHIPEGAEDAFKTIGEKKTQPKSEKDSKKDVKENDALDVYEDDSKKDVKEDDTLDAHEDDSKKDIKEDDALDAHEGDSKNDGKEDDAKDDDDVDKDNIIQKDIKKEEKDTD